MKKFTRILQNYLVVAFPFVLAVMIWGEFQSFDNINSTSSFFLKAVWELGSWNPILWFLLLIAYLLIIIAYPPAREQTLRRIANLSERDEREEQMTGRASRNSYISTISVLIFLLFISVLRVNLARIPPELVVDDRKHTLSIGFKFKLVDEPKEELASPAPVLFDSRGIPLSKTAILLIILLWQLVSFNLSMRKQSKIE